MSGLTREQRAELSADDFADPLNRTMPLADDIDVKRAVFRSNTLSEPRRSEVRRRIVEVALRKGLKIPPSLGVEAIGREISDYNARQGQQADSSNPMRFEVGSTADVDRACSKVKERLEERGMSTQTFQQRHNTPQGQSALQQVHDITARYGAICKKPANLSAAEFVSKHESSKLQEAHDLAVAGGARCNEQGASASPFFSGEQPTLRDPRQRAREHAERRNRQIRGESGAATPQAELSEPAPSTDPMEAARERARATARKHIEKRNRQIEQRKADIKEGRDPFWWKQTND